MHSVYQNLRRYAYFNTKILMVGSGGESHFGGEGLNYPLALYK